MVFKQKPPEPELAEEADPAGETSRGGLVVEERDADAAVVSERKCQLDNALLIDLLDISNIKS